MSKIDLYQGDCLDVMSVIQDHSIDLIVCDLPYGTTGCSWDILIPFDSLWKHYNRVLKPNGIIALFSSQPFTTKLIGSNFDDFRYELIWIKNNCSNFQLANVQPLKYHENICIFYKDIVQTCFSSVMEENMQRLGLQQRDLQNLFLSKNGNPTGWVSNKLSGTQIPTREQWDAICKLFGIVDEYDVLLSKIIKHTYNPNTDRCNKVCSNIGKAGQLGHLGSKSDTYVQENENYPQSVLYFERESQPVHPTQKPLALLEWLIKTYSNEGDTILDNCMGSGTTGVACKHLHRNFIGIELDQEYFDVAKKRIETATFPIPLF